VFPWGPFPSWAEGLGALASSVVESCEAGHRTTPSLSGNRVTAVPALGFF
jgi:hypothetical protein